MGNPSWDPNLLLVSFIISAGLNYLVFIVAYILQTDIFTDFTGSVTYISVAVVTLMLNDNYFERQVLFTVCVTLFSQTNKMPWPDSMSKAKGTKKLFQRMKDSV